MWDAVDPDVLNHDGEFILSRCARIRRRHFRNAKRKREPQVPVTGADRTGKRGTRTENSHLVGSSVNYWIKPVSPPFGPFCQTLLFERNNTCKCCEPQAAVRIVDNREDLIGRQSL